MSKRYDLKVLEMLKNYRFFALKVKKIVKRIDPGAKIYVFGSVVKGKYTGASDIDILVLTEKRDLRYKMMVEVYKSVEAPIELHIVNIREFKEWYTKFISSEDIEEI